MDELISYIQINHGLNPTPELITEVMTELGYTSFDQINEENESGILSRIGGKLDNAGVPRLTMDERLELKVQAAARANAEKLIEKTREIPARTATIYIEELDKYKKEIVNAPQNLPFYDTLSGILARERLSNSELFRWLVPFGVCLLGIAMLNTISARNNEARIIKQENAQLRSAIQRQPPATPNTGYVERDPEFKFVER
jgi:hypothetical protein